MDIDLELIASGYGLVEGPRTDANGALWFTDMFGETVNRYTANGQVETVIAERPYSGGLVPHADGGLILSGHSIAHWRDGKFRVLRERVGTEFFNDLHTDAQGRVYGGTVRGEIKNIRENPDPCGEAFRIELDGSITELYGDVGISNGIGFSPDGHIMYHADSSSCGVWAHDIDDLGNVSGRRHIGKEAFPEGIPDGLCVDTQGNIWVAHYLGSRVVKLDPSGVLLDEISVPGSQVTSCAFGGSSWRDLYIVSGNNTEDADLGGCVWHCRPGVTGVPTPLARI